MVANNLFKRITKSLNFLIYRFRYLLNYMIIGLLSVSLEVLIVRAFSSSFLGLPLAIILGFVSGVFLSFILNSKLNFNVPRSKNRRTFIAFSIISLFAFLVNISIMVLISGSYSTGYGPLRFFSAALVFLVSYSAHRKITFDFVKKVGIAVYLNEGESVKDIYSKIKYYSDFIHIDLIDSSFNKDAPPVDLSIMNEINNTWILEKMLHIMSDTPSDWIKKLHKDVDSIIFHIKTSEGVYENISLCKYLGKRVGLVLSKDDSVSEIVPFLPLLDFVQVMGIDSLGVSGQSFNPDSLKKVNELNRIKKDYHFDLVFDGGVKPTNVWRINSKYIVSSSGLLRAKDPVRAFMVTKTSSRYRSIESQLRSDIISDIGNCVDKIDFVKSANVVGTFSEEKGLRGISDIDLVLIVDKLTKDKYNSLLESFEALRKNLQSKYGYPAFINPYFGPLKFNEGCLVIHLMVYDIDSHLDHCIKSPFTCLDWQRTRIYFKKHLKEISKVHVLQPNHFFSSRRSVSDYINDLDNKSISFREYSFNKNSPVEIKKSKPMDQKHRIEFSYHIMKFLMLNFLKLYYKKNVSYEFKGLLREYFNIFPLNKAIHSRLLLKLKGFKDSQSFPNLSDLNSGVRLFIKDFEKQFKKYFYDGSTIIYFSRHAKTPENKPHFFLGNNFNPGIIAPSKAFINDVKASIPVFDLVYSSPLKRCVDSAILLSGKGPLITDLLKEIDYGRAEGLYRKDLDNSFPELVRAWNDGLDARFPGGENHGDVLLRVKKFFSSIKNHNGKSILVTTHNVVLRSLIGSYLGIPKPDWVKIFIPHLDPLRFVLTRDKKLYIELTDSQIREITKNL